MTTQKQFLLIGRAEGTSLLVLLFLAMPCKYLLGEPLPVRIVGMLHGLLFIAYAGYAYLCAQNEQWGMKKLFWCLFLSCVPSGTFYFEKQYLSTAKKT